MVNIGDGSGILICMINVVLKSEFHITLGWHFSWSLWNKLTYYLLQGYIKAGPEFFGLAPEHGHADEPLPVQVDAEAPRRIAQETGANLKLCMQTSKLISWGGVVNCLPRVPQVQLILSLHPLLATALPWHFETFKANLKLSLGTLMPIFGRPLWRTWKLIYPSSLSSTLASAGAEVFQVGRGQLSLEEVSGQRVSGAKAAVPHKPGKKVQV